MGWLFHYSPKLYEQLIGTGDGQWAYGFRFPINEEEVTLKIPPELWFDFKLNNTGNISPVLLAKEIVDKLKFDVKEIVADSTPLSNSKTSVHEEYQKIIMS